MNVSNSNSNSNSGSGINVVTIRDVTRALIYFCGIDFNVGEPCNCLGCKRWVEKFKYHRPWKALTNEEQR